MLVAIVTLHWEDYRCRFRMWCPAPKVLCMRRCCEGIVCETVVAWRAAARLMRDAPPRSNWSGGWCTAVKILPCVMLRREDCCCMTCCHEFVGGWPLPGVSVMCWDGKRRNVYVPKLIHFSYQAERLYIYRNTRNTSYSTPLPLFEVFLLILSHFDSRS